MGRRRESAKNGRTERDGHSGWLQFLKNLKNRGESLIWFAERLKFVSSPVDRRLELGSTYRIPCKAQGSPPPTVNWIKVRESIRTDMNSEFYFNSEFLIIHSDWPSKFRMAESHSRRKRCPHFQTSSKDGPRRILMLRHKRSRHHQHYNPNSRRWYDFKV